MTTRAATGQPITHLLQAWSSGNSEAGGEVLEQLYRELRRIARHHFRGERQDHTLQPTAVVHEAFLELSKLKGFRWQDRVHFLALSARLMRRILIDYSRERKSQKRGGQQVRITLSEALHVATDRDSEVEAVDAALSSLEAISPVDARIVELRFFGGLTLEEIARTLEISSKTVGRRWRRARAWLYGELLGEQPSGA